MPNTRPRPSGGPAAHATAGLLDRLRSHASIGGAPLAELEWLVGNGELQHFRKDEVLARPGEIIHYLYVVLSGRIVHHLARPYGVRKVIEWRAGDVTGLLPYSRMGTTSGTTTAVEASESFSLPRERLEVLPTACPELTAILVHVMVDRARHFTSADLHDQRALALGKVAAGLAHELNNPASALIRNAKTLAEILGQQADPGALRKVQGLDDAALRTAERLIGACRRHPPPERGALERADREQAIEEWLAGSGHEPELAGVLADSGVPLDELLELAGALPPATAPSVLAHVARAVMAERLAAELESGAARVFHLVSAVKRFTHMDQAMVPGRVDVNASLRDAASLLGEKAAGTGVALVLELAPDIPDVHGVVEELNQMWHALMDNALDAATPGGRVVVTSDCRDDWVRVEVHDDGPGIPTGIRDRIFDPFFTTKPVGRGVGLGLELVRRVVDQHHGEIDVDSEPGRTVFRVVLPCPEASP